MASVTEKSNAVHLEGKGVDTFGVAVVDGYESYGLVKSRFDELSIPRTLWVFKRVVLVVLAVYTGYVCEGFEVSSNTNTSHIPEPWLIKYSSVLEDLSSPMQALSNNSVTARRASGP
jgi:hypothetical protein